VQNIQIKMLADDYLLLLTAIVIAVDLTKSLIPKPKAWMLDK